VNTSSSQNVTLTPFMWTDEFVDYVAGMLRCSRHRWVEEQQTGHRVCAWCNHCEGGCG
jgi:hypothetical protein